MARTKREFETPQPHEINEKALVADMALAEARDGELIAIDSAYGDGEAYDRVRLESEVKFYLQRSGEAFVEAGRRLILLKEHEGRGTFINCLERVGIAPRAAQKMMFVALKFSNTPSMAHLGSTKLLELTVLDDEEIHALSEGGTVADFTFDDIDKMSVRELRNALRESEAAKADADATVAKKDKMINELDARLSAPQKMIPWDEQVNDALGHCVSGFKSHTALTRKLSLLFADFVDLLSACESPEQSKSLATSALTEFNEFYSVVGAMFELMDERVAPLANQ